MDENKDREERYRDSVNDLSVIRKQIDGLTKVLEDLVVAIRGNDFGNDGLIKRVGKVEVSTKEMENRMDDLSVKADKRANQIGLIAIMSGTFMGIFIKWLFDYITTKH